MNWSFWCRLVLVSIAVLILLAPPAATGAQSNRFLGMRSILQGTILPSHKPRAVLDDGVAAFYDAWKAPSCGPAAGPAATMSRWTAGRVRSPAIDALSVSEGIGLGMLIVPHMAGYDPDARTVFDGLYLFFRDHPSQHDPDLMAWRQMGDCASSGDPNSASDGDLNIAYGLLLAHAQWGSGGKIAYRTEALQDHGGAAASGDPPDDRPRADGRLGRTRPTRSSTRRFGPRT